MTDDRRRNAAKARKMTNEIVTLTEGRYVINEFNQNYLNPYINYHRPCFFPIEKIDAKGKQKKIYPYQAMMTPYEKLKSLPEAKQYLKPGMTFKQLDDIALSISDNEAANQLNEARKQLFKTIHEQDQRVA